MTEKTGITAAVLSVVMEIAYAATNRLTWLFWAFVLIVAAAWIYLQVELQEQRREAQQRDRERVRLQREREEFEIWCSLQEERAHRRIMETAVSIHDRT